LITGLIASIISLRKVNCSGSFGVSIWFRITKNYSIGGTMLFRYFFTLLASSFPDSAWIVLEIFFTGFYSKLLLRIWLWLFYSILLIDSFFGATLLYGDCEFRFVSSPRYPWAWGAFKIYFGNFTPLVSNYLYGSLNYFFIPSETPGQVFAHSSIAKRSSFRKRIEYFSWSLLTFLKISLPFSSSFEPALWEARTVSLLKIFLRTYFPRALFLFLI
jgi:hypothetical protein